MLIKKACNIDSYLNQTKSIPNVTNGNKLEGDKKLKLVNYFDDLYSYPPRIKIKWDRLDDLKQDKFIGSNYSKQKYSFPFFDKWFLNNQYDEAVFKKYEGLQYFEGFLEKVNSSNFFLKKTKQIQKRLSTVPIFVVENGHGELVLSKPSRLLGSKNPKNFIKGKLYDSAGAFDSSVEKKLELGLFFMDHSAAEQYLKEIARNDVDGTQTNGLSIQCISLDSAYKITREFHPGVDFRFVPSFDEVKNLLDNKLGKSDLLFEDEQQQLRFRYRIRNLLPYFKKISDYISPRFSFLQNNEYFKGVPIYIVQVENSSRNALLNFGTENYYNVVGIIDSFCSQFIQYFDKTLGFGHNWIMQGSVQKNSLSDKCENYIFFEKREAIKFSKKHSQNVVRYKSGRISSLGNFIRKPRILVYNLEDFLEDWEDRILGDIAEGKLDDHEILTGQVNHFIPPSSSVNEITSFASENQNVIQKARQTLNVKFKVLQRTIGILFSVY